MGAEPDHNNLHFHYVLYSEHLWFASLISAARLSISIVASFFIVADTHLMPPTLSLRVM